MASPSLLELCVPSTAPAPALEPARFDPVRQVMVDVRSTPVVHRPTGTAEPGCVVIRDVQQLDIAPRTDRWAEL
ncbi:hypothetical protein [Streptomyces sp. NPDC002746]